MEQGTKVWIPYKQRNRKEIVIKEGTIVYCKDDKCNVRIVENRKSHSVWINKHFIKTEEPKNPNELIEAYKRTLRLNF